MASIKIELTESDIRDAISEYILRRFSQNIPSNDLHIQVKSKQNYKSEWEMADIRVNVSVAPQSAGTC